MTAPTPEPQLRPFRLRYLFYAAALVLFFFLILDGVIVFFERKGSVDTQSSNDPAWLSSGNPWHAEGNRYVVGPLDKKSMAAMTFKVEKGAAWRGFMLGGSFMRGIPYDGAGTMRFWLKRSLTARFPNAEIELINAAAVSQNSHRVKQIVQYAAALDPNVLIIASCNNEGALAPDEVTQRLHKSGTFRLFKKWLRDDMEDSERPLHTPQDPDIDSVRNQFRQNLIDMVESGRRGGATVFLCTLPVNLRYEGNSPGRPISGPDHDSQVQWPECVSRGHGQYLAKEFEAAIRTLKKCGHEESLRWTGLSWYALGKFKQAEQLLNQYLELVPRNRCRPSFNQVIRDVAQSHNVALVDLEQAARQAAPHGLPGGAQFESYCHMNWQSQARMADTMLAALRKHRKLPTGSEVEVSNGDRKAVFNTMKKLPAEASY